jgi:hypothetical protein
VTAVADPLTDERWAFLLERAGLDPAKAPERFAELREGYPLIARMQKTVRRQRDGKPRERAAEPSHIFNPKN